MMIKLGKINQDDIDACYPHFQKLDRDGDGELTVKDLNDREKEDYETGHGVRETRTSIPAAGQRGSSDKMTATQAHTEEKLRP